MKILVTGASGFLGSNVSRFLVERGDEVVGTRFDDGSLQPLPPVAGVKYERLDVRDAHAVADLLSRVAPDRVYHYAGQAYVVQSWDEPRFTYDTNLTGTLNILEAARRARTSPSIGFAGSGTEYGAPVQTPTPESTPYDPKSPYAASKVAADLLCLLYFERYGLPVFRYRVFGTTGPGKVGDSSNDFARGIAQIERTGQPGVLRVGNIDTRRDIGDVRDAVRAMALVLERGKPGEAYNIARGEAVLIRDNIEWLISLARVPIRIEVEAERRRPLDEPVHWADVSKLRDLGWVPQVPVKETLREILEYWRGHPGPGVRLGRGRSTGQSHTRRSE